MYKLNLNRPKEEENHLLMFKQNPNRAKEESQLKTDQEYFNGFPLKQYQSILERYYLYREEIDEINDDISTDKKVLQAARDQKESNEKDYENGKKSHKKYIADVDRLNKGIDYAKKSQIKNMGKLLELETAAKIYKDRYLMLINEDYIIKKYGAIPRFKDPFTHETSMIGLDMINWESGISTDILSSETESVESEEMQLSEDLGDFTPIPTTDTIYHEWIVKEDLNKN
jgi:hypothetical protein